MKWTAGWLALGLTMACGAPADEETEGAAGAETGGSENPVRTATPVSRSEVRPRSEDEYPRPPMPWAEMSTEQRGRYMADVILPYFRTLFQEYDAERYASFGCQTCHGANMNERSFAMPNPDLMPLHASGTPEQRQMVEEHPRMVRFMFNHVVPAARAAVGGAPYDPETREGFGCMSCHTAASADDQGAAP